MNYPPEQLPENMKWCDCYRFAMLPVPKCVAQNEAGRHVNLSSHLHAPGLDFCPIAGSSSHLQLLLWLHIYIICLHLICWKWPLQTYSFIHFVIFFNNIYTHMWAFLAWSMDTSTQSPSMSVTYFEVNIRI